MSRYIYKLIFSLSLIFSTSTGHAEAYWNDTKESVKSGSHNIALASKSAWNDSKKISISLWHDTKHFSIDLWGKTKQAVHDVSAPPKSDND